MSMNTKQCKGCRYWRSLANNGGDKLNVCHYNLDTARMRVKVDDKCLSRKSATVEKSNSDRIWRTKTRKWDTTKAIELRAQGMTYPAIAAELGTTKAAVAIYFREQRREVKV